MSSEWLAHIKATTDESGRIEMNDEIIEWKRADILSKDLADFKRDISELASRELASVEAEFLRINPEAAGSELFLRACAPDLENGVEMADWKVIEEKIQSTIKQFYSMDLSKFGSEMIKPLMDDIYFFVSIKRGGDIVGFVLFAITPALKTGDIKIINLLVRLGDSGLEKALISSVFKLVPEAKRVFLFVRPTNEKAMRIYHSLGFKQDMNPFQDPNHKMNSKYLIPLECFSE